VNVTSEFDSDYVLIKVNGHPHVHFLKKYYRGYQAYRELKHTIEINLKDARLRLEYDERQLWLDVAHHLSEAW
jgi:hypothetical protein